VAPNNTSEGRSKNRRIEVILTPKLDEIAKLLNEI
jgi:chemotaxis protein MotB